MSDQQRFQELTQKIGQKLWSIMPETAKEMYYRGMFYDNVEQSGPRWLNKDGSEGYYGDNVPYPYPYDISKEIALLLWEMKGLDIFAEEPWDHVKVTLTEEGKISFQYAYVPEVDNWPNMHMRGVSDLSDEELNKKGPTFREDWALIVKKMIPHKRQDADKAESLGKPQKADRLRQEADDLQRRLDKYLASLK